ncbi:helix-turn-helix transcriptional regulator [Yersinia massiliensis]|uniref:helix-turn-helix domain-containing protein n=1 Tax=Yersinia massiliensis TaxID=419257 RepID=UPI0028D13429|nr:helix-turn-helix transcriptional regulator [Yersinia massiliensis]
MSYEEKSVLGEKKPVRIISEEQINRFGERLKIAMNGMSNNAFAKLCGWSEKVIRNYLNGESYPSLDRLVVIANVSGCSIGWLASGYKDDISDNLTRSESAGSAEIHATPEQQQIWKEILDRMTPDERKMVIDKVFRYGITSLLAPIEVSRQPEEPVRSQFPWPDDFPEKTGISHNAMVMALRYDAMSDQERLELLADIERSHSSASGHKPSDKQAG